MRKRKFITNAFILTATSIITRLIGLAFRSYMSEKIGSQGIGSTA